MNRAQITIPDVVFFAAALLILGAFAEPIYQLLNDRAANLGPGEAFLLQMVVPSMVITMLIIIFAIAVGGRP